jgi:membrane-associated phospholipid phosphatase
MALIFWEDRRLRRIFLTLAVLFGLGVLFAHVHYSIDVFASPLIVYSIFAAARRLFPGDFHIISGPQTRTPAKGISSRDAG